MNQLAEKLEPLLAPDQEAQEQRQKTFAEIAAKHAVAEAKVVITDDVKNVHEEEVRRRSAVIIGLSESSDDISEVRRLCHHLDPCSQVTEVFRMGKRSDKPRLLKVHFASSHSQRSVLASAKNLQDSEWSGVFIRRSMTSEELKLSASLRKKCAELN